MKISKMFEFEASRTRYRYLCSFQKPSVIQHRYWRQDPFGERRGLNHEAADDPSVLTIMRLNDNKEACL
jgi:hypothetical protein